MKLMDNQHGKQHRPSGKKEVGVACLCAQDWMNFALPLLGYLKAEGQKIDLVKFVARRKRLRRAYHTAANVSFLSGKHERHLCFSSFINHHLYSSTKFTARSDDSLKK